MFLRLKIAPRLALLIFLGTSAVLAAISFSDYVAARRVLEKELREKAGHLALATARELEVIQRAVEKVVLEMAIALTTNTYDLEQVHALLESSLQAHEEIYGSAVLILESEGDPGPPKAKIPYAYRDGDRVVRKDLAEGDYPFYTFDWYRIPRELRAPIWTEPYYDEGGGESLMVTYSVPLLSAPGGTFRGVVTGDLSLDWLEETLAKMDIGAGGYAFLISRKGTVISHPEKQLIMKESVFSLATQFDREDIREVGRRMTAGETGFVEFEGLRQSGRFWMAYTPIPDTGWSLAALFPQEGITAELFKLSRLKLLLGGLGGLSMVAVAWWIARSITRPIRELDDAAQGLAAGDLDTPLPSPRGHDEVAHLTESFSRMQRELRHHMQQLEVTTAAKARIDNDLKTARTIQLDMLPSRFTFEPPQPSIEIHAALEPARAVGGDFYDFFLCGPDRLFVTVADVSGKGVPAALFMAISKAYLKAFATQTTDPAEALSKLNDELAIENDEGMFLTAFCARVDLRTGECRYASGGHNPPLVLRRDGSVETVPQLMGPLIGLDREKTFESGQLRLEPGDLLLAFSDGVVEAENAAQDFYGDERSCRSLAEVHGRRAREIVEAMLEDVRKFADGAPQSDDITILGLRYRGDN